MFKRIVAALGSVAIAAGLFVSQVVVGPVSTVHATGITKVGNTPVQVTATGTTMTLTTQWATGMTHASGDLLVARIAVYRFSALGAAPTGWHLVTGGGTGSITSWLYYRAPASGSESAPIFSITGTDSGAAAVASVDEYTGTSSSPLDVNSPNGGDGWWVSGTFNATISDFPPVSGGITISALANMTIPAATCSETADTTHGWVNSGWYSTSNTIHGGGDYHVNPVTTGYDQESGSICGPSGSYSGSAAWFAP
jgi:hypothetical protein